MRRPTSAPHRPMWNSASELWEPQRISMRLINENYFGGSAIMANTRLHLDAQEGREIARHLVRVIDDVTTAQRRFEAHAAPAATGRDEVSVAVAKTTAAMGKQQHESAVIAARDLRRLSDSISAHVNSVQTHDADLAALLGRKL